MGKYADEHGRVAYEKLQAYQKRRKRERGEWLGAVKVQRGCGVCGYSAHPAALGFHHIDPATKHTEVARMKNYSKKRIVAEIEKCVVLCANCHAELTWGG